MAPITPVEHKHTSRKRDKYDTDLLSQSIGRNQIANQKNHVYIKQKTPKQQWFEAFLFSVS